MNTAETLAIVPAALAAAVPLQAAAPEKPNIVVIMADDLLTTELSCYGGKNIETPNIDRIAREGVKFTNNYASEAMSVPIRASLYTGLYPMHHGSYRNHKASYGNIKAVYDYMTDCGYRVGRAGKRHTNPAKVYRFEEIPGFTESCVSPVAPYSCDGIRKWMSGSDEPFLLYVCSINTHAPWTWGDPSEFDPDKLVMPQNCVDSPEMREIFTHYLAEVRALDNEVGSVLETLEEIGKLDDTIVMFLGEQGPQFPGGKWTLWYPGCHSAMLVRYPKAIRAGSVCPALVQYEDILPTFIDIAGGEVPGNLDGMSFRKCIFGKKKSDRRYVYGIHNNLPEGRPYPIRSIRDGRYALIMNLRSENDFYEKHLMNPAGSHTGVWEAWTKAARTDERAVYLMNRFTTRPAFEFYDLKSDPWEENNLIDSPKHQKRIAVMKAELLKWMEEQGDAGAGLDIKK